MTYRLLRLREVMSVTGLGSSTLYRYIQAGTFPAPVKIGGVTARWRESVVHSWIDALPDAQPGTKPDTFEPSARKSQA